MPRLTRTIIAAILCQQLLTAGTRGQGDECGTVLELIRSHRVSSIRIIHIPTDLETRIKVNEAALRRMSQSEVILSRLDSHASTLDGPTILSSLAEALSEWKTGDPCSAPDLRWGILLLDADGNERGAIFVDKFGQAIQIGGGQRRVQGKTLDWIKKSIQGNFK